MQSRLRISLVLALSLVLVVTGQTMALARSAAGPPGEMVLCTATGPVTVQLGADGQPTDRVRHLCPDCTLHFFTAVLPPARDAVLVPRIVCPSSVREALASVVPPVRRPAARDPPA